MVKDQIRTKSPRSTTFGQGSDQDEKPKLDDHCGHDIVLMPFSGACGVSRIIEGASERERLKDIVRSLTIPEDIGIVIHTAGEGKQAHCLIHDLHMLLKSQQAIVGKVNAPDLKLILLYQEPSLIVRAVNDCLTEEVDRILVDNHEDFKRKSR